MLHVGAPCSPVKALRTNEKLTGGTGWVTLNQSTLQHTVYPNIFGMGDCTNLPTAKTVAAVGMGSQNEMSFVNNVKFRV